MDRPAGTRKMTTFKNDPISEPNSPVPVTNRLTTRDQITQACAGA